MELSRYPKSLAGRAVGQLFVARLVALVAVLFTVPAHAEPAPGNAAREFDAGVEHFEQAEYEAAARAFLRADVLAPSSDALANAIAAARKANDHLLVAEAAERAVARERSDPGLAARGRDALAQAARHLARVELRCEAEACELSLDGARVEPGARFVLPGTHAFSAVAAGGARADETQALIAGTTYRIALRPVAPGAPEKAADVSVLPNSEALAGEGQSAQGAAPANEPTTGAQPESAPLADAAPGEPRRRGLHPAWFYGSAVVTAALVGVTTWSGIDTLSARDDLPDAPTETQVDDVRSKVRRTDVLLVGSVIGAGVTAYLGLWGVEWSAPAKTAVVPLSDGALLTTGGRF